MLGGLVTALRTLTILPIPGKDAVTFSHSLYWFPFVGLLLGALLAALGYVGSLSGWHEFAALLVVLGGIVLTRGMHADGLADVADGFWGGRSKEAALRIMKDPTVGSFGALALSGVMLLKWVAVVRLLSFGLFDVVMAGILLARLVQVLLASALPYARREAGTASAFVAGAGAPHAFSALLFTLALLFPFYTENFPTMLWLLGAALVAGSMVGMVSYRKIGGVTGDVLGAGSELTEVAVWITGALLLSDYLLF
uniref:Adenosylcobinamide-GDP ribazoletransferase n=1 Tax=Chlorobium chlorochromatii (strain CaD3) TaxID=340177 RepID=COBS_CHLCH|nr:RecName: Full=Adenosylcobinamide-GDP ribazoletransferase; AltName: Full=Cobalamin synthase; AltName: Full=Cobalamin-5'-phosphate synthase [Chlorobium chlorochromatii CaD3]